MKRLLYVEDDPILGSVTTKALSKRGYDVTLVETLSQAEPLADNYVFDFALLDLKLADGLTLELIPKIKQQNNQARILVLTGYASIATAVQAIKLGANDYLSKPTNIDDILNTLQNDGEVITTQKSEVETMSVKRLEWEHIQRALAENNGNISATARQLKMHRRTLQRKLQKKPVSE